MNGRSDGAAPCPENLRELVVWFPTSALTEEERRLVESHAASCPACGDLLRFAAGLRETYRAVAAAHPDPELLVKYIEEGETLAPEVIGRLRRHLEICEACAEEAVILEDVDRMAVQHEAAVVRPEARKPRRGLWDALAGSLLRPAAAAAYLVVAASAIALLVARPAPERAGRGVAGETEPVLVLPDASAGLRGEEAPAAAVPQIEHDRAAHLVLELTGLETAPSPGQAYALRVTRSPSGEIAWEDRVAGATFADNYTLLVILRAGLLAPGSYQIEIAAPDGRRLFRSPFTVR